MSKNPRKVPYGWKDEARKLVDKKAQKIIKRMVEERRQGLSWDMIAKGLNDDGVRGPRGGQWGSTSVKNIVLANNERFPLPAPKPRGGRLPFPPTPEELIAKARAENPDAEFFEWEDMEFDPETREYAPALQRMSIANWEEMQVQSQALKNLTIAEKAERFRFQEPMLDGFGTSVGIEGGHGVDEVITEMTRKRGYHIHKLIDELTGQPKYKALLRQLANLLCREIAIQRQVNVSRRQELAKLRNELSDLRNPKPAEPISQRPEPAKELVPRGRLELRKTIDGHTVKQTFPKG